MNAASLYKALISRVAQTLRGRGFSKKGNCFFREAEGNWGLIGFQKSRKSSADEVVFTLNIGTCSGRLLRFFFQDWLDQKPSIEICHWRERIGFLLPDRQDKWWTIKSSDSIDFLVAELNCHMVDVVFPSINQNLSDGQLCEEWLSGRSPGLTDIQRLMNLSVLLKTAKADDYLHEVLHEMARISEGKPTSSMVKRHFQNLNLIGAESK